ncbi:response regulator transcription factor [Bhargavaea ginsengi]|uniref:response regulator transcription factor n=1 Tax=Bhargavaea ginsengi TaxID=426757 RepID=UPI0020401029|nr:response regulator transcription factor [Bhargavaea ginsengi]MCM3089043.1 response regulator transcription factor [Bhargavaea ginsengi]
MKQRLMVVEDDQMMRELISLYLKKGGYEVIEAADGEEAKSLYPDTQPCLVILDLMMPKVSGEEFCRWVKARAGDEVAIIMLSAKSKTEDKINGLHMGADDYLTKPFDPGELVAHVEAVLRRTGRFCRKLCYDRLCLKPLKGEVTLDEQPIHLTKHEFLLLHHLMKHPNIVFSRDALIEQLYPSSEQVVLDRTIDAHIKKLREKIEDNPPKPMRIVTVRGMGYKFVAQ